MYRYKDFSMMNVFNVSGKKIGFIKDIVIDLNSSEIKGVQVSPYNLFIKNIFVSKENIISFNNSMIIRDYSKETGLTFKSLKNMDVLDSDGNMIGMFEDIVFNENFIIKGIVLSSGIIRKLFEGKKVVLVKDIIVGERNILLIQKSNKLNFVSILHNFMGVNCYEEKN